MFGGCKGMGASENTGPAEQKIQSERIESERNKGALKLISVFLLEM